MPRRDAAVLPLFPEEDARHREQIARKYHGTTRAQIEPILERLGSRWQGGHWVDPCAGAGEIPGLVHQLLPHERLPVFWTCYEIRNDHGIQRKRLGVRAMRNRSGRASVLPGVDFLGVDLVQPDVELVITNLPWPEPGLAIVKHAFQLYPHADVLALYDLCTAARDWRPNDRPRAQWLAEHAPDEYRLPWRQVFAGERGGYPHAVAWLHWPRDRRNRSRGEYEYLAPG